MRILTSSAMRAVDRRAIEEIGIPSLVLMENAALGVLDALLDRFPDPELVLVLVGPGNNGGDGLALARQLETRGVRTESYLATGGRPMSGDAEAQLEICRRLGLLVSELPGLEQLAARLVDATVVVDALFGTGLTRPLEGAYADLVTLVARSRRPVVAVDIPSGLSGSQGEILGPHLSAELTVTFAAPKIAHIFPPACEGCGTVVVADLGVPSWLVDTAEGGISLATEEEVGAWLLPRARDGHKGTFGHLLLLAGSVGKSGAATLGARAAVRSGAGLVTLAVPAPLVPVVEAGSLESMTLSLAGPRLEEADVETVVSAWSGKTAFALGPGLGTEPGTVAAIHELVARCPWPMVLDADALNAFAGDPARLRERRGPAVLTPHPGELRRLLGTDRDDPASRIESVRRAASETDAVVVLKGDLTLVARPDGAVSVNPTGNPGMATGGSGDVLTGLLGGLLAQGFEPSVAAELAVWVHGASGDLVAEEVGERALAASDLLDCLPRVFARLEGR